MTLQREVEVLAQRCAVTEGDKKPLFSQLLYVNVTMTLYGAKG